MQPSRPHPAVLQLELHRSHTHTFPESRVLVIITGGTICMMPSDSGLVPARGYLKAGLAPFPQFNDGSYPDPLEVVARPNSGRRKHKRFDLDDRSPFVKPVQSLRTPPSRYDRQVRYCVYEFDHLIDSSSIDGHGWDLIAEAVSDNYARFDGFVILHGTDSLAYSASALSFMLENLGKPVVLTGSQAPVWQLQTDAADNLLGALVVAGHFMLPEVCLFFDQALYRGNRTTKVSADSFAAFASPNLAPLATVSGMRTRVNWDMVCRPAAAPFTIATGLDTSCVACLRIFPGIRPGMVDSILRMAGLRGLVLESFGAGHVPTTSDSSDEDSDDCRDESTERTEFGSESRRSARLNTLPAIFAAAVERGIVVVNVSQCLTGAVLSIYAPGKALVDAGVVLGHDMTSEAALTKLAYLLSITDKTSGKPLTQQEVAARMAVNLRGELTEQAATRFAHPLVGEPFSSGPTPGGTPPEPSEGLTTGSDRLAIPTSSFDPTKRQPYAALGLTADQTALTTLSYAIQAGDLGLAKDTLSQSSHPRRLLSEGDYVGNTALHIAVSVPLSTNEEKGEDGVSDRSDQHTAILRFLLAHGASVHVRNCAGHTPLFVAAKSGNRLFVKLLKCAGAHLHPAEVSTAYALARTVVSDLAKSRLGGKGESEEDDRLTAWVEAGVDLDRRPSPIV